MRNANTVAGVVVVMLAAGCIGDTDDLDVTGDEIDCAGLTCDWTTITGTPIYGPTWHAGDLGVDLSNPGPVVIELQDVLFAASTERQLVLRTRLVRDATATMSFDFDFYAPGSGAGATFWDRAPIFLVTRHIDVVDLGVVSFVRSVLVPSEGAALVMRVNKDGTGLAMFDELTVGL